MAKINILGITLTDCSLKEALSMADEYVSNGALNTILYVTAPMLILAGRDDGEKERIEAVDLTMCGDADILRVARIESRNRIYEVENHIFLKEFLRRLMYGRRSIYLLTDSEENEKSLRNIIQEFQRGIFIAGSRVIGEEEDADETANIINDVAPTVIISRMASGKQEEWMCRLKPVINAEVWMGIPEDMKLGEHYLTFRQKLVNIIYKKIFHTRINRYNGESDKNG